MTTIGFLLVVLMYRVMLSVLYMYQKTIVAFSVSSYSSDIYTKAIGLTE